MEKKQQKIYLLIGLTVAALVLGGVALAAALRLKQVATTPAPLPEPPIQPSVVIPQANLNALEPESCEADLMLVIDRSGTMVASAADGKQKFYYAKKAAKDLVNHIQQTQPNNSVKIGIASYGPDGNEATSVWSTVDIAPTTDYAAVISTIDKLVAHQSGGYGTCIECALLQVNQELVKIKVEGRQQVAILLSDGEITRTPVARVEPDNPTQYASAEQRLFKVSDQGKARGIAYYSVGFARTESSDKFRRSTLVGVSGEANYRFTSDANPEIWSSTFISIFDNVCETPEPSPTAPPTSRACYMTFTVEAACNQACDADDDCSGDLICSGGMCRNEACTGETDCTCPGPTSTPVPPTPTPTPVASCNNTCTSDATCAAGHICSNGSCRNPSCTSETDCTCPVAPTATPVPLASCNNTCTDNASCAAGLSCVGGMCRNPSCSTVTNCVCPVPTTPALPTAGNANLSLLVIGMGMVVMLVGLGLVVLK